MEDRSLDKKIIEIHQILQRLVGFHRQLLEVVRSEREALASADLKGIQESTYAKEALIESIKLLEAERIRALTILAAIWKKPVQELTVSSIAILIQGEDPKGAEQLRSSLNALAILVNRIQEQNDYNRELVERSLEHLQNMKNNVLGETVPKSQTYNPQGQRSSPVNGARLFSKEI